MARYTSNPVPFLTFTWVDSNDKDPPVDHMEVTWKGELFPLVQQVEIKATRPSAPQVVMTMVDGFTEQKHPTWWKVMRDMQKYGVVFPGIRTITEDVVRGAIRLAQFRSNMQKGVGVPLDEVMKAACGDATEDAQSDILELVKDGPHSPALAAAALQQNYDPFWQMVNGYMAHFGYAHVAPVPIDPASL